MGPPLTPFYSLQSLIPEDISQNLVRNFGLFFWVGRLLCEKKHYKFWGWPSSNPIKFLFGQKSAFLVLVKCLNLCWTETCFSIFPQTDVAETLILRFLTHYFREISFRKCSQLFNVIKIEYAKYEFSERCKLMSALKFTDESPGGSIFVVSVIECESIDSCLQKTL